MTSTAMSRPGCPTRTSIHFHCWEPDTYLDFFAAAREKVSLDFELAAFAPPEAEDDGGQAGKVAGGVRETLR